MNIEFQNAPNVIAGISEKADGSMVWWNRLPLDEKIRMNRDRYFSNHGIDPSRAVAGGIAHGTNVTCVDESHAGKYILDSDGLITHVPNLFLNITVADCLPVYFVDPVTKSIGMAHAGWRGLVNGILEKTVEAMHEAFASRPRDVRVVIGPHIHSCHYFHGEELVSRLAPEHVEYRDGKSFVKLGEEAEMRLRAIGVDDIRVSSICTYDNEQLYSARRDKTDTLEGMMAYIGLAFSDRMM